MSSNRYVKEIIGRKNFGDTIDITDPCHKRDVWCRMNDVKIVPGRYTCIIWKRDNCVGIIGIYLDGHIPNQKSMKSIGSIGVDAGMAGFAKRKPDYTNEEWSEFCEKTRKGNAWIMDEGFFSSSGHGDGEYEVYAYKNSDGAAKALEIQFI